MYSRSIYRQLYLRTWLSADVERYTGTLRTVESTDTITLYGVAKVSNCEVECGILLCSVPNNMSLHVCFTLKPQSLYPTVHILHYCTGGRCCGTHTNCHLLSHTLQRVKIVSSFALRYKFSTINLII